MAETFAAHLESPIGWLEVRSGRDAVLSIRFLAGPPGGRGPAGNAGDIPPVLESCLAQLGQYFRGQRTSFRLPLRLEGTPFQRLVWEALLRVPYGRTTTYENLAAAVGRARASRAVGGANHRNPISIVVPCHRVVGSDGGLVGYGGGVWRKEWLLAHERANAPGRRAPRSAGKE